MDDHTGASNVTVDTEQCSTNFYFTIGKDEQFNCQFTVRGNPTAEQIDAHLRSAIYGMQAVVKAGGKAKQVGAGAPVHTNGAKASSSEFEIYIGNRGKRFIRIPDGMEQPQEITCELHGKKMKRNSNDRGAWYSHQHDGDWCSVAVPGKKDK